MVVSTVRLQIAIVFILNLDICTGHHDSNHSEVRN